MSNPKNKKYNDQKAAFAVTHYAVDHDIDSLCVLWDVHRYGLIRQMALWRKAGWKIAQKGSYFPYPDGTYVTRGKDNRVLVKFQGRWIVPATYERFINTGALPGEKKPKKAYVSVRKPQVPIGTTKLAANGRILKKSATGWVYVPVEKKAPRPKGPAPNNWANALNKQAIKIKNSDTSQKIPVRVDAKTTIYINQGESKTAAIAKYQLKHLHK